jgi:hypothetical protein
MTLEETFKPKHTRYEKILELDTEDLFRLKLFKKEYPDIFIIEDKSKITDVDLHEGFLYLKEHYLNSNRSKYITLLKQIHYFLFPIDNINASPEFMWEMMVKYDGNMRRVTEMDRRKWKIKEVLK